MCTPVCDVHLRGICKMSAFPAPEPLWMILSAHEWLIQARSIHYWHVYYAGAMRAHVFVISICEDLQDKLISSTWITLNDTIYAWVTYSSEEYTLLSHVLCRCNAYACVCDIHLRGICKMSSFSAPESLWMIPSAHEWLIQARSRHYYHVYYAGAMRAHVFVISICEVFAKWAHFQHLNHFEWYHLRMSDLLTRGLYTILTCMMQVEYLCTCLWYPSARYLQNELISSPSSNFTTLLVH